MIHNELLTAIKKVGECDGAVRSCESVVLVELDHGEVPKLGIESIIGAQGGFFLGEEGFAGCEPFGWGYDLRGRLLGMRKED
jgi:hypothetical protein